MGDKNKEVWGCDGYKIHLGSYLKELRSCDYNEVCIKASSGWQNSSFVPGGGYRIFALQ